MRDEHQSALLEQLTAKLRDRTAVIGIIGLGYLVFERNTYRVRRFVKGIVLPTGARRATPIVFSAD